MRNNDWSVIEDNITKLKERVGEECIKELDEYAKRYSGQEAVSLFNRAVALVTVELYLLCRQEMNIRKCLEVADNLF